MVEGSTCNGGFVDRLVKDSWLYRFATAPARAYPPVLEEAAVLRAFRCIPGAYLLLLTLGGLTALGAGCAARPVASAMAATLVLSARFPRATLLLLPALFIWAPRLNLAVAGDEQLFVRLDQAALAGILSYIVLHPRGQFRTPPAHTAFLAFLMILGASVVVGSLRGTLATPHSSLLYLGQWLEFYALYVVAYSLAHRWNKQAETSEEPLAPSMFGRKAGPVTWLVYAWALPLVALGVYGLAEHAWPYYEVAGVRYRTFERIWFPGQANHAGGLFALATATGLAMATQPRFRALGLCVAVLSTLALFPTGSRSGVVAWAAGLGALLLIYIPATRWWLPPLGLVGLCAIPTSWWRQMAVPGSSMHDRLIAWKSALSTVDSYPVLGLGAGARHRSYYDNHYLMTLSESGVTGLTLLALLLIFLALALAHGTSARFRMGWWQAGALAGLFALAIHALATATFIVTMVAGPFFWLCGIALAQPKDDT